MTSPLSSPWTIREGSPIPQGVTWIEEERAFNFAIYSRHAESVTLLLYGKHDLVTPLLARKLTHEIHKSGRIWHCRVGIAEAPKAKYYAYSIRGPKPRGRMEFHAFDAEKILLDPFARSIYFPPAFERRAAQQPGSNAGKAPLGVLAVADLPPAPARRTHHEADCILYELHVRGFTMHPSSEVAQDRRGTFLGLTDKIPYLKDLGVTAVELMPIFQYDPQEGNYWGYMPLSFFAPHDGYACATTTPRQRMAEVREMVNRFHNANIEVILDVVYNHTAEGDHLGPTYSFKGIDNSTYYLAGGDPDRPYADYTGTGNTLHTSNHYVRKLILESLRFWSEQTGIDGFRFDLASVFTRRTDGSIALDDPGIFADITADPVLSRLRLIAEPWDAAASHLGHNLPGMLWAQWNAHFRDDIRRFVRGDAGMIPSLMRRLYGSDDLFPDDREHAFHAYQSINYVTCHDGFTLYDLVSYNQKRNWANGEENRDGTDQNYSWNCGWEGDQNVPPEVRTLRMRQAKNFCCLLLLANGTPMIRAGDEFLQTQGGNNNPYNQDNVTSWLDWSRIHEYAEIVRFFRLMIRFRKAHPSLCRSRFWRSDVHWYGAEGAADLSDRSRSLAFFLGGAGEGDADLYVMINGAAASRLFIVQEGGFEQWRRAIDTSRSSPGDIVETGAEVPLSGPAYEVAGRSVVVLLRSAALRVEA